MGRGDRKTGKGKTFRGSYGNTRARHPGKTKDAAVKSTAGLKKKKK